MYHFYDGTIRIVSIASPFQDTGVTAFQAKRKNVEADIGTSFVNDADDPERNTYLSESHAIGTNALFQYPAQRRGESGHVAYIGSDSPKSFFGQPQSVVFRIVG